MCKNRYPKLLMFYKEYFAEVKFDVDIKRFVFVLVSHLKIK